MFEVNTLALVICFCYVTTVSPMSWRSKDKHRNYMTDRIAHGFEEWNPCEDDYTDCYKYFHYCPRYKIIQQKCKITCGTCGPGDRPPQVNCTKTKYGCCWEDKVTPAKGPNYEGCKPCVDEYAECKFFRGRCNDEGAENIRLTCPVTCNVGCHKKQCLDDKFQAPVCKIYRKFKFCTASKRLMKKICSKTCGFC